MYINTSLYYNLFFVSKFFCIFTLHYIKICDSPLGEIYCISKGITIKDFKHAAQYNISPFHSSIRKSFIKL